MRHADDIVNGPKTNMGTYWTASRPIPGPFVWRLFDAWAVLTGKADAVVYGPRVTGETK